MVARDESWERHDPGLVAAKLGAWWRATGTQYYATPGVSAVINLRNSWGDGPHPQWRLISPNTALAWKPPASIEAINWMVDRRPRAQLWRWDMHRAFLAAMAAVQLPFRQLYPTGTDPTTLECGYYRIANPAAFQPLPAWVWPNNDRQGTSWVCQGTLKLLAELTGHPIDVIDSWTPHPGVAGGTGHRKLLKHWAEDWRDIRLADMTPVKQAYAQLVGLMNAPGGQLYRPDWRHMIIDQQRASMIRRILAVRESTGMEPVAIRTDAVYYRATLDARLIETQLGIGGNMGNMRFEGLVKL
jgi:hypothetical protein